VRVFDTRKKAENVVERILSKVREGSIILLHEGCRDPVNFREMVDSVVQGIRGRGLTFTDLEALTGRQAYQSASERRALRGLYGRSLAAIITRE